MKKTPILFLFALLLVACGTPEEQYVKKAVRLMDRHGLFATGEPWKAAKAEALAAKPATMEEAHAVVCKALEVAGGKHSFIMPADMVTVNVTSEWEMPSVELRDGIAVIYLPPFSGNDDEGRRYVQTVLDALPDTLSGAVIDLRGNSGGNMYPMIAAVHRFLPDDLLRFRNRKNSIPVDNDYILNVVGIARQAMIDCPVAILTNELTASSGEATLLCFRGLQNMRVFGTPTAGYASSNVPYPMPDGSQLVLTVGSDVTRTGEEFCDDPIVPDSLTESPMEEAIAWLLKQ
jgi:C-terminal processing protease CtpA/Prc